MKHIFHIISKCDLGGAEKVAANLSLSENRDFKYHICEVFHTATPYSKMFMDSLLQKGVVVHVSPYRNKRWAIIFYPYTLFKLMMIYRPIVIHTHTEIPDISVYIFRRFWAYFLPFEVKYIRTLHNVMLWNKWKYIGSYIESFFIRKTINIAISENVKRKYIQLYGGPDIPVVFNGVLPAICNERFCFLKKNKKNILFAGRFDYQKGIENLIQVVNALQNNNDYYFHIVGEGPLNEKLLTSLNTINNHIYTSVFELSRFLSSFDYLFMPSLFEGLSILAIEACMNGTPLIANACDGIVDVLPPDWELLVHDNSLEEYLNIFENRLLTVNYEDMVTRARNYALERFSLYKMRIKYEEIYYLY